MSSVEFIVESITKHQTPKGNYLTEWIMSEYNNTKQMKNELYCEKVEAICSHVRSLFDVTRDSDFVPKHEMSEEIVKDLSEKYNVNLNLLHKILFK